VWSIRPLESLTTWLLILGVLSQYNRTSTTGTPYPHSNHGSIVHHNVVHLIFLENSILLLYAGDSNLKSILYKIVNDIQVTCLLIKKLCNQRSSNRHKLQIQEHHHWSGRD
jgi:hypothetical protein